MYHALFHLEKCVESRVTFFLKALLFPFFAVLRGPWVPSEVMGYASFCRY
ncbi:MAG: hypothetical protein ACI92E_000349, partial [Oceanicoccus sp.]